MLRIIIQLLLWLFPWRVRRLLLNGIFGYEIDPLARIGFSIILSKRLILHSNSYIGHLSFFKGLSLLRISEFGRVGNLNWVTAAPQESRFFSSEIGRIPAFLLGAQSAITHRHLIDCTNTVSIGCFSILGGWGSQILTHAIDLKASKQLSAPVTIGDYCFIGTRVVLLKGSKLPNYSVLAAGSVLSRDFNDQYFVYGGCPATKAKPLEKDYAYFSRTTGVVN
jgi:acetyltransferase-like isoleucine patch superfamily enzyme